MVVCALENRECVGFFDTPGEPLLVTEGHGSEDGVGNAQAGRTDSDVFGFRSGGSHGGRLFLVRFWTVARRLKGS